jgi:hypothetical protein
MEQASTTKKRLNSKSINTNTQKCQQKRCTDPILAESHGEYLRLFAGVPPIISFLKIAKKKMSFWSNLKDNLPEYVLNTYFVSMGVAAAGSAIMYWFKPEGTAKYFGGTPTNTAKMWVRTAAGGDALVKCEIT